MKMSAKVIVGLSDRSSLRAYCFAKQLAHVLQQNRCDVRILLMPSPYDAERTGSVTSTDDLQGLPFETLPVNLSDTWGRRWQILERYLEQEAPCIYILSNHYLYDLVVTRLSDRIGAVCIVHSEDSPGYDQLGRWGAYLNAIVTLDTHLHWICMNRFSHLTPRILNIPVATHAIQSLENSSSPTEKTSIAGSCADNFEQIVDANNVDSYIALFETIERLVDKRKFIRPRGWMSIPDPSGNGQETYDTQELQKELLWANQPPLWPDTRSLKDQKRIDHRIKGSAETISTDLQDHRLIIAMPGARISGSTMLSTQLIRHLRSQGIDARAVGGRRYWDQTALDLDEDIPIDPYPMRWDAPWSVQWQAMIDYLERMSPCIFLLNSDETHAAVVPRLSNRIKVVSVVSSDEPGQYAQLMRLGRYSDLIVGVSKSIVHHISELDPELRTRLVYIPYGTDLDGTNLDGTDLDGTAPAEIPVRSYQSGEPIRLVYVGRIDYYQKRCDNLCSLARTLVDQKVQFDLTLIGDGPDREKMEKDARQLVEQGVMHFLGMLPNSEVQRVLCDKDIFILPSVYEGGSLSLLEAMAHGLVPLISDARSGIPELIQHGINGFVIPGGDISLFSQCIRDIVQNPSMRSQIGAVARETIQHRGYCTEDMVGQYVNLFQKLLTGKISQDFVRRPGRIAPPDYLKPQLGWRGRMDAFLFHLTSKSKSK